MTNTLEADVLALLTPGGTLTADTIARNLGVSTWRTMRVLRALRDSGNIFQNGRAAWQVSAGQR